MCCNQRHFVAVVPRQACDPEKCVQEQATLAEREWRALAEGGSLALQHAQELRTAAQEAADAELALTAQQADAASPPDLASLPAPLPPLAEALSAPPAAVAALSPSHALQAQTPSRDGGAPQGASTSRAVDVGAMELAALPPAAPRGTSSRENESANAGPCASSPPTPPAPSDAQRMPGLAAQYLQRLDKDLAQLEDLLHLNRHMKLLHLARSQHADARGRQRSESGGSGVMSVSGEGEGTGGQVEDGRALASALEERYAHVFGEGTAQLDSALDPQLLQARLAQAMRERSSDDPEVRLGAFGPESVCGAADAQFLNAVGAEQPAGREPAAVQQRLVGLASALRSRLPAMQQGLGLGTHRCAAVVSRLSSVRLHWLRGARRGVNFKPCFIT